MGLTSSENRVYKLYNNLDQSLSQICLDKARIRATSHLCVKRERPLIITHSFYSENIMHYHFYLKYVRGEE